MTKSSEYVYHSYDYQQVDKAFQVAANRASHLNNYIVRQGFVSTALGVGVLLVCIGIFILFTGWGYRLWNSAPIPVLAENSGASEVVKNNKLATIQGIALKTIDTLKLKDLENNTTQQGLPIALYKYTIFKTIPFDSPIVKTITVGMQYGKHGDQSPEKQWCYIERLNKKGVVSMLNLADKLTDQVVYQKFSPKMALEFELTDKQLIAAQNLCTFE